MKKVHYLNIRTQYHTQMDKNCRKKRKKEKRKKVIKIQKK
jgi:hypothetical protein